MNSVTVIVPVKNGERYLEELLDSVGAQQTSAEVEVLIVDSGSTDSSVEIAKRRGVRLIEIAPREFGHGRTRNMAAEQASGDVLVFLTQDATPAGPNWLASLIEPILNDSTVGLAFGPHLPRPQTSPMVARELDEFFGSFSPHGSVRIDSAIDVSDPASSFFSNVNSAMSRRCWQQVRFREIPYAEDQAFARDALAAGWKKAYVPAAGVLHAHDYPFTQFMRRYFDEYRGLRESVGHVQPRSPATMARTASAQVRADLGYMRSQGVGRSKRALWGTRSAAHHSGKAFFSALGSRAHRLPAFMRSALSLEGRNDTGGSRFMHVKARRDTQFYEYVQSGTRPAASLTEARPKNAGEPLEIAWLVPPFKRGSGGHMTIFTLIDELERRGNKCSIWIHDPHGEMKTDAAGAQREIVEHFVALRSTVHMGFDQWRGTEVAVATGWQTAYPLRELSDCSLKSYLVQDHEPEFYATSSQRIWSEATYDMGYFCICASPWLRDLMRERYGTRAEAFELGVDFDLYQPQAMRRDPATIVYYARPSTPRRATELGMLALANVVRERPDTRVVVFGDTKPKVASFDFELAGIVDQPTLAHLYNEATVGLVISLTNYSRMPKEMMACGLPVVDIDHPSVCSVFGTSGEVIALAKPQPLSIAGKLLELLNDPKRRQEQADAAHTFVAGQTWEAAAGQIERHLRSGLRERMENMIAAGPR